MDITIPADTAAPDGDAALVKARSTSSTASSTKEVAPVRSNPRSHSHSLLSSSSSATATRKAVQAEAEQTKTTMDRASISMPPPAKPPAERRFSTASRKANVSDPNGTPESHRLPADGG